ncbi:MAG: ribosomal RNA small subunit methyltransferase A [Planctomycetes bacterium]|nr:ribosomal RNA small subunit methyltransferase A [Planctomycetota bacterium]
MTEEDEVVVKNRPRRSRSNPKGASPEIELGQHFLVDREVLEREVYYAELTDRDDVLEVGPGTGNLTELLVKRARRVVAIERDRRFADRLTRLQQRHANLDVRWGDATKLTFPRFDKFVANLPYRVALPVIFKVLDCDYRLAVVICQARMAERICASVGEPGYCRLSVCVQRLAAPTLLETVPPDAFSPPPEVESAIVLLKKARSSFAAPPDEFFKATLDALFVHRYASVEEAIMSLKGKPFSGPALTMAVRTLDRKIRKKEIHNVPPREFGTIARAVWNGVRNS